MTTLADAVEHLRGLAAHQDTDPATVWAIRTVLSGFDSIVDHVQGVAWAHRWDTNTHAHTLAGHILNVIVEQRGRGA